MIIKTHRHLVSSLHGANFRRVAFDGRTWCLRAIPTMRRLQGGSAPGVPVACIHFAGQ